MAHAENPQRLGLALSGGGLRASFYHIGVLAQMAEQGLLRHVEALSTVSGGSIIGALYYLHVKKLLETKTDEQIVDQDYVDIVKAIEQAFLKATENNIRTAVYADFRANLKMLSLSYSRSDLIADYYERWIYRGVLSDDANPIRMQDLKILPRVAQGTLAGFRPKTGNADRQAKVPMLVINATTLNTGRGWEFTAVSMGEPTPRESDATGIAATFREFRSLIDKKPLRLVWADSYGDMIPLQQDFSMAHAVAASACVPGLFDPLAVSGLYRNDGKEVRVQLVDGGVFDNQGVEGLVDNGCTCFVVSDASGQMGTENDPSTSKARVLARTSSILQDRSRTKGLLTLFASVGKKNVAFFHLRQGLGVREAFWIDRDGKQAPDHIISVTTGEFGFDPRVQDCLSRIRTDLDAFTEVEAYSLMLNGYKMSKRHLETLRKESDCPGVRDAKAVSGGGWDFLAIEKWAQDPTEDYLCQLHAAQAAFGKILMLSPGLWIPFVAAIVLPLWLLWPQAVALLTSTIVLGAILIGLGLWLIDSVLAYLLKLHPALEFVRTPVYLAKSALQVAARTVGSVPLWLYLKFINPLFLKRGRLSNLKWSPGEQQG
ncbi:patatin-like phospholipase family protein [uncultured Thiodictyon sp.]|uniref:patatin-like phospholipase family protein n=1 Tax=uncultured Thiodictyon sp. TaxID=1846217 RepID=UPI0025D68FF3|nr:patatin-like phospholipase family protein [uncultured Thiodictyon sp.]